MSIQTESATRLIALKDSIENKTGATYTNLTDGINALINGYGTGIGSGDLPEVIQPGDIPILGSWVARTITETTDTDTGASITIPKTGTYRFRIFAWYSSSYYSGSNQSYPTISLYKNNNIIDSSTTNLDSAANNSIVIELECEKDDVIKLYAKGATSNYGTYLNMSANTFGFVACINK